MGEKRKAESAKIMDRYQDRIPVICEKSETSKLPDIDKTKYLVPKDLAAFNFNHIIRKRIKLPETSSLYFFVNGRYLLKGGKFFLSKYFEPTQYAYLVRPLKLCTPVFQLLECLNLGSHFLIKLLLDLYSHI